MNQLMQQAKTPQDGQAMVEMIVISFVTLLLLFSIVQFALLYNAKTLLNYAAYEAARAGAVNYSHPYAMRLALAQKLATLEPVSKRGDAYDKLTAAQENVISQFDNIACIKRVNPAPDNTLWSALANTPGTASAIANDHLLYRNSQSSGPQRISIQDANLLKISVTYCPKMIVPMVATAVKRLMLSTFPDPDPIKGWQHPTKTPFEKQCYENNRFPMVAQAIIRMQTPVGRYGYQANDCRNITSLAQQIGKR